MASSVRRRLQAFWDDELHPEQVQYVNFDCFRGFFRGRAQIVNLASCDILALEHRNFTHETDCCSCVRIERDSSQGVAHCHGHQDHNVVIATDSGQK